MTEAAKNSAILRTLADQVAQPSVAGRGGKSLSPRQRRDWAKITDVVCNTENYPWMTPQTIAKFWKEDCRYASVGVGWLSILFWNWAFPLLVELAKRWIESQRNAQGPDGDR